MLIGFAVAAARESALGSPWIAPLAVAGLLAHGVAAPLVVLQAPGHWNFLFAGLLLAAVWMILCAAWPLPASARARRGRRRATRTRECDGVIARPEIRCATPE